jgi:hypothetical protein
MATINLGYRLVAESEKEALEKGIPQLQALWEKILVELEKVEKDCMSRFPDLVFEVEKLETQYVGAEEWDEIGGKPVWDLSYWIEVTTTSPDGMPDSIKSSLGCHAMTSTVFLTGNSRSSL